MRHNIDHLLAELHEEGQRQIIMLKEHYIPLSEEEVNWRPGPYRWNILEVVEHLNRFGDFYLPQLRRVVNRPRHFRTKDDYSSGWLGEFACKRIRPMDGRVPFKTKTPSKNNPFLRILDHTVFDVHLEQQSEFADILTTATQLNLSRNRVPTMLGKWATLNLGDSLRVVAYHTERHYVQLDNLLNKNAG